MIKGKAGKVRTVRLPTRVKVYFHFLDFKNVIDRCWGPRFVRCDETKCICNYYYYFTAWVNWVWTYVSWPPTFKLPSMLIRHCRHIALVVPDSEHDVPLIPDTFPPFFFRFIGLIYVWWQKRPSSSSFQGRMHNIVGSIQSEIICLLTV